MRNLDLRFVLVSRAGKELHNGGTRSRDVGIRRASDRITLGKKAYLHPNGCTRQFFDCCSFWISVSVGNVWRCLSL